MAEDPQISCYRRDNDSGVLAVTVEDGQQIIMIETAHFSFAMAEPATP